MKESSKSQQKLKKSSASGIVKFFDLLDKNDVSPLELSLLREIAYAPTELQEVMYRQKPTQVHSLVQAGLVTIGDEVAPLPHLTVKAHNLFKELEALFKPVKEGKQKAIPIDLEKVKQYNELFPAIKYPHTQKYARCNQTDLVSAFTRFFKMYPTYTDWSIILKVTERYVAEKERDNWNYARTSKYFVVKQMSDRSHVSNLAEHYQMELEGIIGEHSTPQNFADEKVV